MRGLGRKLAALALSAELLLQPISSSASDFAELGHPGFVRSLLLDMKQRRAIRCLSRWTSSGERQRLAPLAEEIVRRVTVSIGYSDLVRTTLQFHHDVQPKLAAIELAGVDGPDKLGPTPTAPIARPDAHVSGVMPAECHMLADAFDRGGLDAALNLLGPAPERLIPLPSPGTCLAMFRKEPDWDGKVMRTMQARIGQSNAALTDAERETLQHDLSSFGAATTITFGEPPQTVPVAGYDLAPMLCIASIVDLQNRLHREGDPQIDMIDSHVHLFANDEAMLAEIDAELAEHPERAQDPALRRAFGLFNGI